MVTRTVTVRAKGDVSDLNRAFLQGAAGARSFSNSLDTSTDRMTNLVQGSLALGPALISVGATAVPVISGLTNQLAFAAAGAGVAALAFSGVGDALKAVNDYAIEPTEANLEKLDESLRSLGPAGREFTFFLQRIRPEMQLLQNAAQGGLLPGVEDGVREFMLILPKFQQIIFNIASAIGELVAEGSRELTSDSWREFFDFIENEARPTLLDMGRTVGNFAEGFANLWMAFDPLSDQFSKSFLQMSRDFSKWTDGLAETEGFQEFVDYIRTNGPQAWDTLGALAGALIEIVEAAAPVGAAALPVIEALSDAIASIADSDVGPAIVGIVALTSAYSRLAAVGKTLNSSAIGDLFGKSSFGGAATAAKDIPSATRALLQYDSAAARASTSAGAAAKSTGRLGTAMGGAAKLAGGAGGLAFVMSDLDDQLGLTNTAMLALAGSMAGPWGAGIGAGIGLVMDFAAAGDTATKKIESLTAQVAAAGAALTDDQRRNLSNMGNLLVEDGDSSRANDDLQAGLEASAAASQKLKFEQAGLAEAMAGTSDAARKQVEDMLDNAAAHNRRADEILTARDAERQLEAAFDTANEAIKENGRTLDIGTEAGRANQENLDNIAAAWNNLTAEQMRADGKQDEWRQNWIDTAVAMGENEDVARGLAESMFQIPPEVRTQFVAAGAKDAIDIAVEVAQTLEKTPEEVETELRALNYTEEDIAEVLRRLQEVNDKKTEPKISADGSKAKTVIGQVRDALAGLKNKTIYVTTIRRTQMDNGSDAGKNARAPKADGGYIAGPGGPREDAIPAWLSNGEFVVNAAATKANLGLLHSINNSRRFADGGAVDYSMARAFGPTPLSSAVAVGAATASMPDLVVVDGSKALFMIRDIASGQARMEIAGYDLSSEQDSRGF